MGLGCFGFGGADLATSFPNFSEARDASIFSLKSEPKRYLPDREASDVFFFSINIDNVGVMNDLLVIDIPCIKSERMRPASPIKFITF